MSNANPEVHATPAKWYSTTYPRKVDIVGDFGGKQLFLVDGDSLLLYSITTSAVDYDVGFQLLHAIFAVESFLQNLYVRGCNFHVVFFDDQADLCVPSTTTKSTRYKYQTTRTILMHHLQRPTNGSGINNNAAKVLSFPSITSHHFHQHLIRYPAAFLLCHDGGNALGQRLPHQAGFQNMIYQFLRLRHSVALIASTEFKSSRVIMSMITTAHNKRRPALQQTPLQVTEQQKSEVPLQLDWTLYKGRSYRELLTIIALDGVLRDKDTKECKNMTVAMILHTMVISHTRLAERSLALVGASQNDGTNEYINAFLNRFCDQVVSVITSDFGNLLANGMDWDTFDIIDGRLFLSIHDVLSKGASIPTGLIDMAEPLISCLEMWSGVSLKGCNWSQVAPNSDTEALQVKSVTPCYDALQAEILPFSHKLLDEFLAPIKLRTGQLRDEVDERKVFQELTHWHNAKRAIDPKRPHKKLGFFARRRMQGFMADTLIYSASLTNATGKLIEPKTIVATPVRPLKKTVPSRAAEGPSKEATSHRPRKKAAGSSGKDSAHEAAMLTQARKLNKKNSFTFHHWCKMAQEFSQEKLLTKRFQRVTKHFLDLSKQEGIAIGAEVSLYLCDTLYRAWEKQSALTSGKQAVGIAALLFYQIMQTAVQPISTDEAARALHTFDSIVGIPSREFLNKETISRQLGFQPRVYETEDRVLLPLSNLEFQLRHCGPFLERTFDSRKDARVPFEPDAWQRSVLDGIDADNSLLIVAPTSSGKTFISFYAMEKILRANDDDVLVYVAPTKALVNQIAAEIQARFRKAYVHEGRCVWAIHTRDYRVNSPTGCQVLVTVPHVLQIMLLSPSNLSWAKRVKRIIFDEVHCIGQADDGIIWEQLLLMAPCPIIALSATVGNPEEFCEWLRLSQTSKGFEFKMIRHNIRYSDLRAFQYLPPDGFEFEGLSCADHFPIPGLDRPNRSTTSFRFIHPVAALFDKTSVDLEELSLEPRDALTLWECMHELQTERFPIDHSLSPPRAFSGVPRKSDVLAWTQKLKEILTIWMQDATSPFDKVRRKLYHGEQSGHSLNDHRDHDIPKPRNNTNQSGIRNERLSVFALLCDLRKEDCLPAILFNYDRVDCERTLEVVLQQLESAEQKWKTSSRDWQTKIKKYNLWKTDRDRKNAKKPPKKTTRGGAEQTEEKSTRDDRMREEADVDISRWESFDPERPLDEFSFANSTRLSQSELAKFFKSLGGENIRPHLFQALERGIAVHHAGMNRRYRQVVEILFRKGYLTAVIATGTLALGINMPCKTVAFIGDSAYLTTLNYRQGAGRAGRRGFDLLGNVVFNNISSMRAHELMSSRLPDLKGHFPLTTTLVLRILGFIDAAGPSAFAEGIVKSLLTQNRLYLGGEEAGKAIQHHLRFSIEYLQRQRLLSGDGKPINFAGLVGHLYFTENAVFAFHSLLKGGYFHRLCVDISHNTTEKLRVLGLVMAHLFNRIKTTSLGHKASERAYADAGFLCLPRLPKEAEDLLIRHNNETLEIFKAYAGTFIDQYLNDAPDRHLPFTGIAVGGDKPRLLHLPGDQLPTKLRSPFSALSGHSDNFKGIHEFCANIRSGVFLEESAVPYIPIWPHDLSTPLNSYIYDFLKHGDYPALTRDNKIKEGDVWFLLRDFSLVLATIIASITNYIKADVDTDDVEMVDLEDVPETRDEAAAAAAAEAAETTETKKRPAAAAPTPKPTKQKVAESWDDSDGDSDDYLNGDGDASFEPAARGAAAPGAARPPAQEDDEDGRGLVNVLTAFTLLKQDFDDKFHKVWA